METDWQCKRELKISLMRPQRTFAPTSNDLSYSFYPSCTSHEAIAVLPFFRSWITISVRPPKTPSHAVIWLHRFSSKLLYIFFLLSTYILCALFLDRGNQFFFFFFFFFFYFSFLFSSLRDKMSLLKVYKNLKLGKMREDQSFILTREVYCS